jgi:hypothetical protein
MELNLKTRTTSIALMLNIFLAVGVSTVSAGE